MNEVLKRAADRLKAMVTLGVVRSAKAESGSAPSLYVDGVVSDELRALQTYGFASRPHAGAEAVVVNIGSHADEAIIIAFDDRRYRLALAGGEVAIYDDLGSCVHLKRNGEVLVEGATVKIGAGATAGAARLGDTVSPSADWLAWAAQVQVAIAALLPPTPLPVPAGAIGAIASASTKVVVE